MFKNLICAFGVALAAVASAFAAQSFTAGPMTAVFDGPLTSLSNQDDTGRFSYSTISSGLVLDGNSASVSVDYLIDPSFEYVPDSYTYASVHLSTYVQPFLTSGVRFSQWKFRLCGIAC